MKLNKILFLIAFITLLSLVGCKSVAHIRTDDTTEKFTATIPSNVLTYATDKVEKEYIIIGKVVAAVDAGEDAEKSIRYLKIEAAELGADAIINLRIEFAYGEWETGVTSSGTAIKFK